MVAQGPITTRDDGTAAVGFAQRLNKNARRHPERIALVCGSRQCTYAELDGLVDRFARGLLGLGVGRGERVVIALPSGVEALVAILGTLRAGCVFVVLHERTPARKLRFVLDDAGARVLMAEAATLRGLELAPSLELVVCGSDGGTPAPGRGVSLERLLGDGPPDPETRSVPEPSADELCALLYTSGSTGVPKAVMQSHRSMDAAAAAIVAYLENEPSDVVLDALPLSFDYGLYNALMPLRFGGRCVLEPRGFTDIAGWLRLVEREQVTGVPVVPPVAALVAGLGGRIGRTYPSVRYVTSTGQALQPAHGRALQRLFPNARLYSMYGLTECKRATFLPPEEYARRPTSVGVAMPGVRLRLVDAAGAEIRGPFERGELLVEGENVMLGYWRRDAETAAVLAPGATPGTRVLRTGDLFERDAEGYYFFVARRDGLVKVGGQRVSPREVEDVLAEVEGVAAAAAFGVEHPILGTAIEAAVVPAQGHELDAGALLEHCRVHLEPAAVPRRIDLVAELPRTENGKTDYARLREAVGGRA